MKGNSYKISVPPPTQLNILPQSVFNSSFIFCLKLFFYFYNPLFYSFTLSFLSIVFHVVDTNYIVSYKRPNILRESRKCKFSLSHSFSLSYFSDTKTNFQICPQQKFHHLAIRSYSVFLFHYIIQYNNFWLNFH